MSVFNYLIGYVANSSINGSYVFGRYNHESDKALLNIDDIETLEAIIQESTQQINNVCIFSISLLSVEEVN